MRARLGFTLIELLVACALLLLVSAAGSAAFGTGLRVYRRCAQSSKLPAAALELERLEREFENLFPLPGGTFAGNERECVFNCRAIADIGVGRAVPGRRVYRFDRKTCTLVVAWREYGDNPEEQIVRRLTGVSDVVFRYGAATGELRREWTGDEGIPARLQLTLTFAPEFGSRSLIRTCYAVRGTGG